MADGASAVAGLIGLAALSIQSVTKLINLTSQFRNVPDDIKKRLEWLSFLKQILDNIRGACMQLAGSQVIVDTALLEAGLKSCQGSVERLSKYLEAKSSHLEAGNSLNRQVGKFLAAMRSSYVNQELEDIQKGMTSLNMCHNILMR